MMDEMSFGFGVRSGDNMEGKNDYPTQDYELPDEDMFLSLTWTDFLHIIYMIDGVVTFIPFIWPSS